MYVDFIFVAIAAIIIPPVVNQLIGNIWCGSIFKSFIFNFIIENSSWGTRFAIALGWVPKNLTNEKSILIQLMAWSIFG